MCPPWSSRMAVRVSRERRRTGRAVSYNSASLRSWSIVSSGGASRASARVLTPSASQASYRCLSRAGPLGRPSADRPRRIALMGFSFGGRTALWASQLRFQQRYDRGPSRFAAHLAFYPSNCHIRLADEDRVSDAPIRIFHGAADEATVITVAGNTSRGFATRARTWPCPNTPAPSTGSTTPIWRGAKCRRAS